MVRDQKLSSFLHQNWTLIANSERLSKAIPMPLVLALEQTNLAVVHPVEGRDAKCACVFKIRANFKVRASIASIPSDTNQLQYVKWALECKQWPNSMLVKLKTQTFQCNNHKSSVRSQTTVTPVAHFSLPGHFM